MKRLYFIIFLLLFVSTSVVWSQSEKEAFLYIDKQPVDSEEFIRLYQKNLDMISDEKQKDLDNYLDLYITYKLKLAEAKQQGLESDSEYLEEIESYRKEQTLRYLDESHLSEAILEDLYKRSKKEINASHILINLPPYSYGKDTVKAYERINKLRERALSGEDFNQLAAEYSEEPGVENSKGNLGYFSSMQMVMPFEDAAYTTPIDGISPIIRTGYGYHILKVHGERPTENKLRAAHIMIMKSKDSLADKKRIHKAYSELQNGKTFAEVVKEYSQDEVTKSKGGELDPFGRNDIKLQVFTDTAYSLEEGTYSAPFSSNIGWHIVKLIERLPHPTKDEKIKEITTFFNDNRGKVYYNQKIYDQLLSELNYKQLSTDYFTDLLTAIDRKYLMSKVAPIVLSEEKNKEMFSLNGQVFYYNDFLNYASDKVQRATKGMRTEQILEDAFENYKKEEALNEYATKLYKENKEYAIAIDEYNNGVLLFNLMQEFVWEKAAKDTLAQKAYYSKYQSRFDLPERWEVAVYQVKDEVTAQAIYEMLNSDVEEEEVGKEFGVKPIVESWSKEFEGLKIENFKSGKTLVLINDGEEYQVAKLQQYRPHEKRDFTSARNNVLQAYSTEFEKQWESDLREKHEVKLNKRKWRKLKRNLE